MKDKQTIRVPIAILGGGLSGLFAASCLVDQSALFVLIESSEKTIGGLAALGGMKIGLLPAGLTTADYIGHLRYNFYSDLFLKLYGNYLSDYEQISNLKTNNFFLNKFYKSYIINHNSVKSLVTSLKSKSYNKIIFDSIYSAEMINNGTFKIHLKSGLVIYCEKIIVASGRDSAVVRILKNLGQEYNNENQIMIGCRATFNSTPDARKLFDHQIDFKVKSKTGFQTYCYNYKGSLHTLQYCKKKYFTGSLNFNSEYGNTFIGKKIFVHNTDFFNSLVYLKNVKFNEIGKIDFNDLGSNYKKDFIEFIEQFSFNYDIDFKAFFFPAFEQFWPTPKLKPNSLESTNLNNLFFIGDASGIAFGVLQCFISANLVIEIMANKK